MKPGPRFRVRRALVAALALLLFVGFSALGTWQLNRRLWKLDLIAQVERQLAQPPVAAPGPDTWSSIGNNRAYLPVTVSGHFLHDREAFVQAVTRYGSGYWLLTPLRTDRGFIVLVNRGFVSPELRDPANPRVAQPGGTVEIHGLLRLSEPRGRLLQSNDAGADRWYSRDVAAIGVARGLEPRDLAPYFIDAGGAPNPGGWPIGGLTVVHFRNTHLAYALTWYALALITALGAQRLLREPEVTAPCVALLAVLACAGHGPLADDTPSALEVLAGARPPATPFFATTPFRLTQNTIQLDVRLGSDGLPASMVVDSGAPVTIAAGRSRKLGLETLATVAIAGPEGGRLNVPVDRIAMLAVGGLMFRDVGTVVGWVQPPDEVACLSRDGLLGSSLLQAAIWQIDFENREITVTDALDRLPGLDKAMRIPFRRADAAGAPRIDVGVADTEGVSLLIDLGFNGSIAIPKALFEASGNRLDDDAPVETGDTTSTVFGDRASAVRLGKLRELRLGKLRLRDLPVVTGGSVSDFHVGIAFLRHFRVTLDWLNDTLYLERRDPVENLYDDFATYGFKPLLRNQSLVVGSLWSDGPADRAGLTLGDHIIAIDGVPTRTTDFKTFCGILDAIGVYGSREDPIAVTVTRGGRSETLSIPRRPLL